jgi:hypothetical protein
MRSFTTFPRAEYNRNDQGTVDEMGRAGSIHGEKMHVYRVLIGKPEGKRPLGSLNVGGKTILEMDLGEVVWSVMDCIHLAQDRDQ